MLTLTRKVTFMAGHIYRGGGLSVRELNDTFGVAAEPSGHGHNYVLEVSVRGPVNAIDGMVVNIKDVDADILAVVEAEDRIALTRFQALNAAALSASRQMAQCTYVCILAKVCKKCKSDSVPDVRSWHKNAVTSSCCT